MNSDQRLTVLRPRLQAALEFAQHQVGSLLAAHPGAFPVYTTRGKWDLSGTRWTNWTEGFLGGMLWTFYRCTARPAWREQAEQYSRLIEERKTDTAVHDLGFLFWPTWKTWYDLSGDPAMKAVVITAGQTLGQRYQAPGGYLCSFLGPGSLFIDIMMNVGIVFYAAQQSGDADLLHKAHQHCLTTRRCLVRGDGSTAHEGLFDVQTGAFQGQSTQQGWRADSTWARGLAWALYGFGTAYQLTGERCYLATARACAAYYLERTPFGPEAPAGAGVPPNDYDDPRRPLLVDSSAGAIAASGLFNLAELVQDPIYAGYYRGAALTILETLCGPDYLADQTPGWQGILQHGVYHRPKGLGVDESVMWGEYFFVEALAKGLALAESAG
jgi:unsaturated chondroitin disaccharide hydrolase